MDQLKQVLLAIIATTVMSFPLWAEDEVSTEQAIVTESGSPDDRMLRQENTVAGFNPLMAGGEEIDATYTEETLGERYGAIIFLHDQGEQFESLGGITPLRLSLPEYGWSTLTVALYYPSEPNIFLAGNVDNIESDAAAPAASIEDDLADILGSDPKAEPEKVAPVAEEKAPPPPEQKQQKKPVSNQQRVAAALTFLKSKGIDRIIFLGHGAGGDMAINLLEKITVPASGLILVGSSAVPDEAAFQAFKFPIFDVYGGNDLDTVAPAVKQRKLMMKRIANTAYESRRIIGADHQFTGLKPTLTTTIYGWLRKRFVEQADN